MAITKNLQGILCAAVLCMGIAGAAHAEATAQAVAPVVQQAVNLTETAPVAKLAEAAALTPAEAPKAAESVVTKKVKKVAHKKAKTETAKPAAEMAKKEESKPEAKTESKVSAKPESKMHEMTPAAGDESGYAAKGANTCLKCHDDDAVMGILKTPHAVSADARTPFGNHQCESCHGASPEHVAGKGANRPAPAVVFEGENKSSVEDMNKVCLSCHENQAGEPGARMNWAGSQHESSDVACTSCHTTHTTKDPVLDKRSQSDTCFTCHKEQRAQSFEFSHHPMREGKVACADCHNPHGSVGPKLLKEANLNDTCYTCHADKRGPLLWEHEPVREDCSICHVPHGANEAKLLKDRSSFICQDCHQGSGHFGAPYGAQNLPSGDLATAAKSGVSARAIGRGCVNCHSQIHGSNSPSGQFLNR